MKIKKHLIRAVIPVILAGTLFCSCDELLNRMPYDGLVKAEFWQSKEDVNAALMGCYDQMQECLYYFVIWGEARGDMLMVDRGDEAIQLNEQIVSQYNGACNWKPFYVLINRANTVIENAPGAQEKDPDFNEEELDAMIAECYFLRAFAYFYLVRTFKEVPLITASYATDDQEYNYPKSPSAEIYTQIIEDLDYAEQHARTSYDNVIEDHGRATRYAINALKADVYLWMGMEDPVHYEKCVDEADKIIQSGAYVLEDGADWFNLYYPGNSDESIFELQYNAGLLEFNGLVDWFSTEGETPMFSVRLDNKASRVVFWTENLAAEDAIRGKNRSYATVSGDHIVWKYSGTGTLASRRRSAEFSDGNWIIYRLAELHLIKAEALNRLGNIEASISEVNIVRQRAQLPPLDVSISSENLAFEILEERKRELAFEGKRWYDLVRYSLNYGSDYLVNRIFRAWDDIEISQRIANAESWFLPIYYEELRINRSLEQNPYYDF